MRVRVRETARLRTSKRSNPTPSPADNFHVVSMDNSRPSEALEAFQSRGRSRVPRVLLRRISRGAFLNGQCSGHIFKSVGTQVLREGYSTGYSRRLMADRN